MNLTKNTPTTNKNNKQSTDIMKTTTTTYKSFCTFINSLPPPMDAPDIWMSFLYRCIPDTPCPCEGSLSASIRLVYPWSESDSREHGAISIPNEPEDEPTKSIIMMVLNKFQYFTEGSKITHIGIQKFRGDEVGITLQITENERRCDAKI